jgi:Ca-activated chloride channel family protein
MKKCQILVLIALLIPMTASATGLLIPKNRSIQPLSIKYHRAEVKITDRVAVTHVDQVFSNHTNRDLEATFIFPLPKGATVSDFYLYMNGKKTKGEVLEKNRARNIYEGIVRRMRDPGLLEYLGQDLFQARVYPVPRKGEARIEIEFSQMLPFEGGIVHYSYPMRTDRASARTMKDFTMSVNIESKTPIKTIYSPSHQIYSRKKNDRQAIAGFEKMAAILDRDFDLYYTVSEKDIGLNLLAFKEAGESGFFMVMLSPKSEYTDKEIIGKHISFVIDTSGSMAGKKMRYAKSALKYCLNKLNSDDRFNVVRFSTDVESFMKKSVSASKGNIQKALNFVSRMEAAGGTAIDEALRTALAKHTKSSEPNLVVFLTDGNPTVGETIAKKIIANTKRANKTAARIFVFGVGEDINTHFLDKISSTNFADSTYVKPGQEIEQRLSSFYNKVSHPVLSDLSLDFGAIHEYDVLPKRLPDLFKGSQVLVLGRYRDKGHTALTLNGKVGKDSKKFVYDAHFPDKSKKNDFIARLWATRKVGYLLDNIRLSGEKKELVDEVISLSKRYGIVTPYTSYLVTEDTGVAASPRQPVRKTPPPPRFRTRPGWGASGGKGKGSVAGEAEEAGPMAAMPAERKRASKRYRGYAKKKPSSVMKSQSGRQAIDFAASVKDMKEAKADSVDEDDAAGIRYLAGRAFKYANGGWVDLKYRKGMKTLKLKYMGKAYFSLLQQSSKLKKIFSLGEKITIVVGKNLALIISPDGKDDVPALELKKFIP